MATFAGTAISAGDGGPSTQADWTIHEFSGETPRESDIADATPTGFAGDSIGTITTLAGNASAIRSDNVRDLAALTRPTQLQWIRPGNVYIADANNERIRRWMRHRDHHDVRRNGSAATRCGYRRRWWSGHAANLELTTSWRWTGGGKSVFGRHGT